MRLKEIFIRRYGPIFDLPLRLGDGVQPIHGPNESGKTLIIDALLKKLIGLKVGWDKSLDRVGETPEGYIVLEDEGQEIKLGENETLATYLNIEPDELKNIFVVRDADLRIASEDVFYKRVTDKITGLRLEDVRKITEQLRESGRITSTLLQVSDATTHFKAKSQLNSATGLKSEIEEYLEKAEAEGLRRLEADIFETNTQKAQLESCLELLEKAKKKDEFQKLKDELESAQTIASDLDKLPEEAVQSLGKRLTLFEENENKRPHFNRSREFFQKLSYLSIIGSFAIFILLFSVGKFNATNLIFPCALLISTLVSITFWFRASHNLSELERYEASIINEARILGLETEDVSSLRNTLKEIEVKAKRLRSDLNQKLGVLKKDLGIKLEAPSEILEKSSEKLDDMKGEIDLTVDVVYDEEDFNKAKQELTEVDSKLKDLKEALEKHLRALEDFSNRAYRLNYWAFLNKDLDLEIKNLDSLKELIPRLDEFIGRIEEDAQTARDALKIFNILEEEENAKVADLFEKGNLASQLFSKITYGKYSDVEYNYENEEIIVRRPTGETFPAWKLSRGASDQLYLAIRVALGQMLLEGKTGFFILDDAFISSDGKRIKQQIDLLKKISEMGWQIIYLTLKNEAVRALTKITENKPIKLKPLP